MRVTIIWVLCFVIVFSSQAQTITLQGKIKEAGGSVLPGVTVTVLPHGKTVMTDDHGQYRVTGLTGGAITLIAHTIGYKEYRDSFLLLKSETKNITLVKTQKELQEVEVVSQRSHANAETLIKVENS